MKIETSELFSSIGILLLIVAVCMTILDYKHHFFVFLVGAAFSALGWIFTRKNQKGDK